MILLAWLTIVIFFAAEASCSVGDGFLYYRNRSICRDGMSTLMRRALDANIKLDHFSTIMMDEWVAENPILEEYFQFIFRGYEQYVLNFDFNATHSWDFLFNQSFIQYVQTVEEKSKIDYIVNNVLIPKCPILKMTNFKFDTELFLDGDELGTISHFTGLFEKATIKAFVNELEGILLDPYDELNRLKYKVLLHSTIEQFERRCPELIPFAYILLNTPMNHLMAHRTYPMFSIFFDEFFLQFVANTFARMEDAEPIIMSIVPGNVYENRPLDGTFSEIMKYYGTLTGTCNFIEIDPLENYLLDAVESENSDKLLLIGNVMEKFSRTKCHLALHSAIRRGDLRNADFLVRKCHSGSFLLENGISLAMMFERREILEHLMKSEKTAKERIDLGRNFYRLHELGYHDLADEILSSKPQLSSRKEVLLNLICNGHEEVFKKIVPFLFRLEKTTARALLEEAASKGNVDLINFLLENFKVSVLDTDAFELAIENNHVKVASELIPNFKKKYLETLAQRSLEDGKIEMSEAIHDHLNYYYNE